MPLRHNITNILPYSTDRGNNKELIGIHGKLRARKMLSLVKIEWLESANTNIRSGRRQPIQWCKDNTFQIIGHLYAIEQIIVASQGYQTAFS